MSVLLPDCNSANREKVRSVAWAGIVMPSGHDIDTLHLRIDVTTIDPAVLRQHDKYYELRKWLREVREVLELMVATDIETEFRSAVWAAVYGRAP